MLGPHPVIVEILFDVRSKGSGNRGHRKTALFLSSIIILPKPLQSFPFSFSSHV